MPYDYRRAVEDDVRQYIDDNINLEDWRGRDRDEVQEDLYDALFVHDSVTGNASGSYTFNAWQAEENLCHNLDLLGEALEEFGSDASYLVTHGAEACDVTIRCYLLGEAISTVLDEYENEGVFDDWEEDDEEDLEEMLDDE